MTYPTRDDPPTPNPTPATAAHDSQVPPPASDRENSLADLGGLPPDVPPSWADGIQDELDAEFEARRREVAARLEATALTAESLYRRRWYAVPDDEVGGWAIATVNRPTSGIDPTATRDRVLAWFVWEEHARWLVEAHNAAYAPATDPPLAPEECG